LNLDRAQALSVLVIEDDPHLAGLLKHVLTAEGFEVRTAGNREEIVAQMRRPPLPDLVLLDVVLPDANGFDVLLRIRQHPALKTIPVVMLTAQATRDAVLKGLSGGADGYITKPFRIEVLAKAVAAVLGLPGHEDEARDSQDPWSL
jgi:two-component system OmpR family response regulator